MAATPSTMLPLGTVAPDFDLLDACSNKSLSLQSLKSDIATVVMFICNHCPYVKHIESKLVELAAQYQARGMSFIAINSNDVINYPSDSPEHMREVAITNHYSFPYLFDESQNVAKAYQAACTPDFYVFDKDLKCIYRGRFDGSTPGNTIAVTGEDLALALDSVLQGKAILEDQKASIGCNIKWKK